MRNDPTNHNSESVKQSGAGAGAAPVARQPNEANLDAILDAHAPGLANKAIQLAHQGSVPALKLTLEAALARLDRRVSEFHLPAPPDSVEDLKKNSAAVIIAHSRGHLRFEQAAGIQALLAAHRKFLPAAEKAIATSNENELSGSADDFEEPFLALQKATGFTSKILKKNKSSAPASKE